MVAARLDPMLSGRVDASDIVQETMMEAVQKLPNYLRDKPLPFYPWLRQLAIGRLANVTRQHMHSQRRAAGREAAVDVGLSDESMMALAHVVASQDGSPSQQAIRAESQAAVRAALASLPLVDREVLILRFVEQLSAKEAASILGITPEAVGMRRLRALRRLSDQLQGSDR
jgi:RNA polymerase sigma-70 factor (ECF subfamily)